jgi:hypothetical protein
LLFKFAVKVRAHEIRTKSKGELLGQVCKFLEWNWDAASCKIITMHLFNLDQLNAK